MKSTIGNVAHVQEEISTHELPKFVESASTETGDAVHGDQQIDLHELTAAVDQALYSVHLQQYPSVFDEMTHTEIQPSAPQFEQQVMYPHVQQDISAYLPDELWSNLLREEWIAVPVDMETGPEVDIFTRQLHVYQDAHRSHQSAKLQILALESDLRAASARAWTLKKSVHDIQGTCGDGRRVTFAYMTETAELQPSQLEALQQVMTNLRNIVHKNASQFKFKSKIDKMWLESFINDFLNQLQQDMSLLPIAKRYLSTLFHFERRAVAKQPGDSPTLEVELDHDETNIGSFTKDVRLWICQFVSVMQPKMSREDVWYLLREIVQVPGISHWGAWFFQPPIIKENSSDYIALLHTALSPVPAETDAFSTDKSLYNPRVIANVDTIDAGWIVVQDDGTKKDDEGPRLLLTDDDLLCLLEQFDVGWQCQTHVNSLGDDFMSIFAFCNGLVRVLASPTMLPRFSQAYPATCKKIGLLLTQIPSYVAMILSKYDETMLFAHSKTIGNEMDALVWRCFRFILMTPGRTLDNVPSLWPFASDLPLCHVSLELLWRMLLEVTTLDAASGFEIVKIPRSFEAWNLSFGNVPTQLVRLLSMSSPEATHIIDFLGAIAHAAHHNNEQLVQVIAAYCIFAVAYLDLEHRESLHKCARTWLASMCQDNDRLLASLFKWTLDHRAHLGDMSVYLFSALPVDTFQPNEQHIAGLEQCLAQNSSIEFAKCIITRLPFQDSLQYPALSRALQRRIAILIVACCNRLSVNNRDRKSLVRRSTETFASAATSVAVMTGYSKHHAKPDTTSQTYSHEFELWTWKLLSKMQLYQIPIGNDVYLLADSVSDDASEMAILGKPYLSNTSSILAPFRELAKSGHGPSIYLMLTLSEIGHRFEEFEKASRILHTLIAQTSSGDAKMGVSLLVTYLAGTFRNDAFASRELAIQLFEHGIPSPDAVSFALSRVESHVIDLASENSFLLASIKFWVDSCLTVSNKDAILCLDVLAKFSRTRGLPILQSCLSVPVQRQETTRWGWIKEQVPSVLHVVSKRLPNASLGWMPRFFLGSEKVKTSWWFIFEATLAHTRRDDDVFLEWLNHCLQIADHPLTPIFWQLFFIMYFSRIGQSVRLGSSLDSDKRASLIQVLVHQSQREMEASKKIKTHHHRLGQLYNAMTVWLKDERLLKTDVNMGNFGVEYFPTRLKRLLDDDLLDQERLDSLLWWDLVDWSSQKALPELTVPGEERRGCGMATSLCQVPRHYPVQEAAVPLFQVYTDASIQVDVSNLDGDLDFLLQRSREFQAKIERHEGFDQEYFETLKLLYQHKHASSNVEVPCQSLFGRGNECSMPAKLQFDQQSAAVLPSVKEKLAENRKFAEEFQETDISTAICIGLLKMECFLSRMADSSFFFVPFERISSEKEYPPLNELIEIVKRTVGHKTSRKPPSIKHLQAMLDGDLPDWKFESFVAVFEPHLDSDRFVAFLQQVQASSLPPDRKETLLDRFNVVDWLPNAQTSWINVLVDELLPKEASAAHLRLFGQVLDHIVPQANLRAEVDALKLVLRACKNGVDPMILQIVVDTYLAHHLKLESQQSLSDLLNLFTNEDGCLMDVWNKYLPILIQLVQYADNLQLDLQAPWTRLKRPTAKLDSSILLHELSMKVPWREEDVQHVRPWLEALLNPIQSTHDLWNQVYTPSVRLQPPDYMTKELNRILARRDWHELSLHHDVVPLAVELQDALTIEVQRFLLNLIMQASWDTNAGMFSSGAVSALNSWLFVVSLIQNMAFLCTDGPIRANCHPSIMRLLQTVDWSRAMTAQDYQSLVSSLKTHWDSPISSTMRIVPAGVTLPLSMILHALQVMAKDNAEKMLVYLDYVMRLIANNEKLENFTLIGVKNSVLEVLLQCEDMSATEQGWRTVLALLNRLDPSSTTISSVMNGLESAISQTEHPLVVLNVACRNVADLDTLPMLVEWCICRDRGKPNRDSVWRQIANAMQLPELGKERFLVGCVHSFSPLTLYAYVVREVEQSNHDEVLKRRLTHSVATWISEFPVAKMTIRFPHVLRLLTLFVKFSEQVQAQLDTITVGEALLRWANDGRGGILPQLFKSSSKPAFPLHFRLFSRMVGIVMLRKVDALDQYGKIIKQATSLVQKEASTEHRDCVDEMARVLASNGGLRDLVLFVDFLQPRLMKT